MIVYYRMSPKGSQHELKRPRYAYAKLELARMCLKSFVEAFDNQPRVIFLLDSCGPEWDTMIKEVMTWEYTIEHLVSTQDGTYRKQLDMAKDVDDYVLFQEDDYVYLKGAGQKLLDAMRVLQFVNPYDHREFYTIKSEFHKGPFEIRLVGEQHWRTIDFDTMTWGCHSGRLAEFWGPLHEFGFWDKNTWDTMAKHGAKLWSPIPSLATHMHRDFLSPGIDWTRRFDELDK